MEDICISEGYRVEIIETNGGEIKYYPQSYGIVRTVRNANTFFIFLYLSVVGDEYGWQAMFSTSNSYHYDTTPNKIRTSTQSIIDSDGDHMGIGYDTMEFAERAIQHIKGERAEKIQREHDSKYKSVKYECK